MQMLNYISLKKKRQTGEIVSIHLGGAVPRGAGLPHRCNTFLPWKLSFYTVLRNQLSTHMKSTSLRAL